MPKPGPKPKPKPGDRKQTPTEKALDAISTTVSRARRRISALDRAFITLFADAGYKDAYGCMRSAGWKRIVKPEETVARLADHIEAERLRRAMSSQMELDEALIGIAVIGRIEGDAKVRLAALRTIVEVHGGLGNRALPPTDRSALARQVAEIIDRINVRTGASPGAKSRVRAVLEASASGDRAAIEVETETELPPSPSPHPQPEALPAASSSPLD